MLKVSSTFPRTPISESDVATLIDAADDADGAAVELAAVAEKLATSFGLAFHFGFIKGVDGGVVRIESQDSKHSLVIECSTDDVVELNALINICVSLTDIRVQLTKAARIVMSEELAMSASAGPTPLVIMRPVAGEN